MSSSTPSQAVAKHKQYLFPAVAMYYQEPIALVKGEGNYVWDDQGRKYLDAFGGVLTVSVGHANPKVVNAIVEQVKKINHTSTLYANEQQSNLAEKLASMTPGNLKKSFFTSSGTEANEKAIAIARKYGGLYIADEVQTAWGRTGEHWWGIQHWDVNPDIMVSAKGMGNGAPVAMTIATPEVADKYPGITFATFGGNPVSMQAALSTIQVIEQDNLRQNCKIVGAYLGERFAQLKEK